MIINETVTIAGQECRALVSGNQITIVTGPFLLDRVAEVIAQRYPYEAELFPRITLTLTQVTIGVMAEIAAMDGVHVLADLIRGDDWGSAQHLADYVSQIVDPGWVSSVVHSVYVRRAQQQGDAGGPGR